MEPLSGPWNGTLVLQYKQPYAWDITSSSVFKEEGIYNIIADSIFINTASVQLKGKMNTSFTSIWGASKISGGGLIINQSLQ